MTTMLDKMAQALCAQMVAFDADYTVWDELLDKERAAYADLARAALQAIREPSPEMIKAASESAADDGEGGNFGPLFDLLDFSGENKTRLVVAEALREAVGAILEEKPE